MPAKLEQHSYEGWGYNRHNTYCIVVCDECSIALNSGHHYSLENKHFAVELAEKHNAEVHNS